MEINLARVLFIPAGQPWFKDGQTVADSKHRLEMVRLAITDNPHFAVSDMEIRRDGPTYTIDTLAALRKEVGVDDEFYFILGVDALNELHRWCRPLRRARHSHRRGCREAKSRVGSNWGALESIRDGASDEVVIVDGPRVDISAADVRRRMAKGLSVQGMVPHTVEDYARRHGLYEG